jgi:hypothetical protein
VAVFKHYDPDYPPVAKPPKLPVIEVRDDGSISAQTEFPWLPAKIMRRNTKWMKRSFPCLKGVAVSLDPEDGQLSISGAAPPGLDIRGFLIKNRDVFEGQDIRGPIPDVAADVRITVTSQGRIVIDGSECWRKVLRKKIEKWLLTEFPEESDNVEFRINDDGLVVIECSEVVQNSIGLKFPALLARHKVEIESYPMTKSLPHAESKKAGNLVQ